MCRAYRNRERRACPDAHALSASVVWQERSQFLIDVFPHVAPAGVARTLYIRGDCVEAATVDESTLSSGTLVVKAVVSIAGCTQPQVIQSYTPRADGKLRMIAVQMLLFAELCRNKEIQ